jgi:hypothetical protein
MKKYILYVFAGVSLLTLGSCDDKPKATDEVVIPPPINGSVMIINEGNYTFGNSSLTVLNLAMGSCTRMYLPKTTAGHWAMYFNP